MRVFMDDQCLNLVDQKQIGKMIKDRRKIMNMTQQELAKYCDLSHTGIGKIEMGKADVKITTLLKLCKILGLELTIQFKD